MQIFLIFTNFIELFGLKVQLAPPRENLSSGYFNLEMVY